MKTGLFSVITTDSILCGKSAYCFGFFTVCRWCQPKLCSRMLTKTLIVIPVLPLVNSLLGVVGRVLSWFLFAFFVRGRVRQGSVNHFFLLWARASCGHSVRQGGYCSMDWILIWGPLVIFARPSFKLQTLLLSASC
ncbi:uncharacterized protein LOC133677396 isoform X2 [Populus nigra]|uniref:uncharacterized protein LOC133677396 isoform X2 n=1 Tax=Populus nigra TaxID=3691 RepID=UPI002B26D218|nr:uncharacterized protein LOC133677396 isoform X2 [Populus nigra]